MAEEGDLENSLHHGFDSPVHPGFDRIASGAVNALVELEAVLCCF